MGLASCDPSVRARAVWVSLRVSNRGDGAFAKSDRAVLPGNLVSLNFASWNRIIGRLRAVESLKRAA